MARKTLLLLAALAGTTQLFINRARKRRLASQDTSLSNVVDQQNIGGEAVPTEYEAQAIPTPENPYPVGNPTPLPTGAAPGG